MFIKFRNTDDVVIYLNIDRIITVNPDRIRYIIGTGGEYELISPETYKLITEKLEFSDVICCEVITKPETNKDLATNETQYYTSPAEG